MSLSGVVEWWQEWQLHILVLASLGLQYLLAIFAGGRRFNVPRWYRLLIWLSYLGSDAVAIYALATLFNRQIKQQCNSAHGSPDLEVLWAPILLIHLGGQPFITAYNIIDNELWRRYIVTTISQVTVAIYVFCKSWSLSADSRLWVLAVLLFFLGSAKCLEKSLSLKSASFDSLASRSECSEACNRTKTRDREKELQEYVQKARDSFKDSDNRMEQPILPDKLFADFPYPYSDRLNSLKFLFSHDNQEAYQSLKTGLSIVFNLLYTKYEITDSIFKCSMICSMCTWLATVFLSIVSISLFHSSQKNAYSRSDIIVSTVLLYGTFLLDITSTLTLLAGGVLKQTSNIVAQHSLIGFYAHSCNYRFMKPCNYRFMKPCHSSEKSCHSSKDITSLIREYVRRGWEEFITDAESYRKFNDLRGQWTLGSLGCEERLGWSLEKPFDESVLLWHVATDFCIHQKGTPRNNRSGEISNYMIHLLFVNPEMLMAGSRRKLFRTTCYQLNDILTYDALLNRNELTQQIIDIVRSGNGSNDTLIHDAWELAEGLMDIHDGANMWKVIQGVWLEMICFSASRCRGYLHAKSLGDGVEYLTFVWLLLAYAGMETLPERLQRTHKLQLSRNHGQSQEENAGTSSATHGAEQHRKKEENVAGPSSSQSKELGQEEEITAASSASQGEGLSHEHVEIVVS